MKLKRFNQLNEGTWEVTKNKEEGKQYISELEQFQKNVYRVFGDDEVFNGLDSAIKRMKFLLSEIK